MVQLTRVCRVSAAAVLAAGLSLAGPQAVGIALADSDRSSAQDGADKPDRGGSDSAPARDDSAASEDQADVDKPEIDPETVPRPEAEDFADPSDELGELDEPDPQPGKDDDDTVETIGDLVDATEDATEDATAELDVEDPTVEEVFDEPEPVEVTSDPDTLPEDTTELEIQEESAGEGSDIAEVVVDDTGAEEVTGGRGGGVTPLPYWRGTSVDPDAGTEPDDYPVVWFDGPVFAEGSGPPALWPTVDGPADGPAEQSGPPMAQTGAEQPMEVGSGKLVTVVLTAVNRILDSVSNWLTTLPSGPFSEFLAGVLLQIRNALPPRLVRDGSDEPVPELPLPDVSDDFLGELNGLDETDATAIVTDQGLTVRIVARDGEYYAVTKDYRTDRINFSIENGVVVKATVG